MFSDFPNLHPLVVHLPIVLLLLSAGLQALNVYKDWPPVKWITIGVMAGGFLGALAASTVFHAMPTGLAPRAAAVFEAHEKFAGYTLWLSGITLLLAGIGTFFKIQRRAYEILVLVSAVATAGVLSVAGHRGAQLVYVEGVGPQGRLLDKSHGHGGEETMPAMDMGANRHDEAEGADDHNGSNAPASPGSNAAPGSTAMPGMDMSAPAPAKKGSSTAPGAMDNMNMPGGKPAGQARPSSPKSAMPGMPGMNMPAAKSAQPMPAGMEMSRPAKQQPMNAMPGMENMPGMSQPKAGAKKPATTQPGMEGMGAMGNMPGMQAPSPKQPKQTMPPMDNMRNMPGMEKDQAMPQMSMPTNPMDKFRFEDNNPARSKPKPAKQ
ncbi:hypothetical protein FY528_15450 [Hymenobacter lutimineralis]|uniref:DUF2231 domain-containing protein n=1 Tax=Hymenobacter lutimineralis TaxID=2606448 RepID=A0A5D6UU13_9BACT|nr:DUF2231 domain-containing protein [Hymenobacter lutimineralis]TYZ07211.1 hypothetical protein FY528_15450 [Hymenobacter lutimineralis]